MSDGQKDTVGGALKASQRGLDRAPQVEPLKLPGPTTDESGATDGAAQAAQPGMAPSPAGAQDMTAAIAGYLRLAGDALLQGGELAGWQWQKWQGWQMSPPEIDRLAQALEACRRKYFPNFGAAGPSEITDLVLVLVTTFGYRVYLYQREQAALAEKAELSGETETTAETTKPGKKK